MILTSEVIDKDPELLIFPLRGKGEQGFGRGGERKEGFAEAQ